MKWSIYGGGGGGEKSTQNLKWKSVLYYYESYLLRNMVDDWSKVGRPVELDLSDAALIGFHYTSNTHAERGLGVEILRGKKIINQK